MKRIYLLLIALLAISCGGKQENTNAAEEDVNIKTLFEMLPADVFPEYLPQDKAGREAHILVCDQKNNYLELGGSQFPWEMCYWNLKDGRKLVAVNQNFETGAQLQFFYYEDGKLREDKEYNLWSNVSVKLEDFIDIAQVNPDITSELRDNVENSKYIFYYQLPRKGSAIKIAIDHESVAEDFEYIPYEAFKQLTLEWVNEKWIKQ